MWKRRILRRWAVLQAPLLFILSMVFPVTALAAYAYNYGDDEFRYSSDNLLYACEAWTNLGLTWSAYFGWQFVESTVLANMPYGNGFYATCHGGPNVIYDNYGSPIYGGEIYTARQGDWKRLVYCDACCSAYDGSLAWGFGIQNGDGSLHCFLGWIGITYDSYEHSQWNYVFWNNVKNHNTIYNSAVAANRQWPLPESWRFYGNPNWAY
ncbi:MAG: hypothetical protein AB1330_11965 [Bacillota bacterium]